MFGGRNFSCYSHQLWEIAWYSQCCFATSTTCKLQFSADFLPFEFPPYLNCVAALPCEMQMLERSHKLCTNYNKSLQCWSCQLLTLSQNLFKISILTCIRPYRCVPLIYCRENFLFVSRTALSYTESECVIFIHLQFTRWCGNILMVPWKLLHIFCLKLLLLSSSDRVLGLVITWWDSCQGSTSLFFWDTVVLVQMGFCCPEHYLALCGCCQKMSKV